MSTAQSTVLPLRAPDAPRGSPRAAPPLAGLLQLLAFLLALGNVPYWIFEYFTQRPAAHRSLLSFLIARLARTTSLMYPFLPAPEAPGAAARPPGWIIGSTRELEQTVQRTTVAVQPAPVEWRNAYAAEIPGKVQAVERPAFILTPPGAKAKGAQLAADGERLIMYIHGGAYIRMHPLYSAFSSKIARDTSLRILAVQYRKCLDDGSAFPAPLLDTLAAWRYATRTLGFSPSNILVTGESAGGHLTLALVQQLAAINEPLPGAIAICSPWVDLTMSLPSWKRNTYDVLCKPGLDLAVRSATRHYDDAVKGGWFSPAFAPAGHWKFMTGVPAFVSLGTAEAFEDEIEKLVEGMRRDGVDVTLWRDVNGIHAAPLLPFKQPETYERYRDGILDLIQQMEIRAGGSGK